MAMDGGEMDPAGYPDSSFASFSKVLSWKGSKKEISWRGFRKINRYEGDVFASAPVLKVHKEVINCSAVGEESIKRYELDQIKAKSDSNVNSAEIQWGVPVNLLMPEDFCMYSIHRPNIKLTPYGEKRSCDAAALVINSLRCELSALLHLVWTIIPDAKYIDHAFMRDCLFPWIDESVEFMKIFAESLFTIVLPAYAKCCPGLPTLLTGQLTLQKGHFLLCLKALSESRYAFLQSLPVGDKFRELVFACTTFERTLQYMDRVGVELWKEAHLNSRGILSAMRKLEDATWKSLLGPKVAGFEMQRAVMRGMVSRWMNYQELHVFAKCRASGPRMSFLYVRKISKAQQLLTKNHECLQCNIGAILESLEKAHVAEQALAGPSSAKRGEQTPLAQGQAREAEEEDMDEGVLESSMHNLYDFSPRAYSWTLDDVPSAPSLGPLRAGGWKGV